jgi:hypothetical protein
MAQANIEITISEETKELLERFIAAVHKLHGKQEEKTPCTES